MSFNEDISFSQIEFSSIEQKLIDMSFHRKKLRQIRNCDTDSLKSLMKIGYDVSATCNEKTGCTWYADSLIRTMAEQHPENQYTLYHHFASISSPSAATGTRIEATNVEQPYLHLTVEEAREEWERIKKGQTPAGNPDVIQANFFDCPPIRTTPVVYVVHDLTFFVCPEFLTIGHYYGCSPGICDALSNSSGIIFVSEYTRKEFKQMFPHWLEESRIPNRVIHHASRGTPVPPSEARGEQHWLTVGTLEPRKNHLNLIAAHEIYWRTSEERRPLVIVGGKGWLTEQVHQQIKVGGALGRIQYHGYVSEEDLNRYYADSFGFIYPSHYEGFGLPVLEAMERGVPVLSTSTTSLPEVGGNAVNYFDPNSPSDIAARMLELEKYQHMRPNMIERGRKQAAKFSWSRVANETLDFYREVRENWATQPVRHRARLNSSS